MFSGLTFEGGYQGADILSHQDRMVELLQVYRYKLSKGEASPEMLYSIALVVKTAVLRSSLALSDLGSKARLESLHQGERD